MKTKIIYCLFLGMILLVLSGCGNGVALSEDNSLSELKELIESNSILIEELKNKNIELEGKISKLEEEKENLNKMVEELQNNDTNISSIIDDKYGDLKEIIDNKFVSNSNNYTITKQELVGTWDALGFDDSITFSENGLEIIDNWIVVDGESTFYYMYKDGKLYVTDNGWIFTK